MRSRAVSVAHPDRPEWDWYGTRPASALGWAAVALAVAHVAVVVALRATHTIYWQPEALWSDPHVVTAAVALAGSAIAGAALALFATIRAGEHSVLMLVPTLLGAFWLFWLGDQIGGWL